LRQSRFFAFWRQTDKRTKEQMDITDALSRSRYRERGLNKRKEWSSWFPTIQWLASDSCESGQH